MKIPGLRTATLLSALLSAPLWIDAAASAEELTSITVQGAGSVEARPDMAIVSAGAVSQTEQVAAALEQTSEKVAKLLALAESSGIAEADVQTEDVSIHPVYEDKRGEAGVTLGRVVRIAETGMTLPVRHQKYLAPRKRAAAPVAPGSLEFGALVAMRFVIGKSD